MSIPKMHGIQVWLSRKLRLPHRRYPRQEVYVGLGVWLSGQHLSSHNALV